MPVVNPSDSYTDTILKAFKEPLDVDKAVKEPVLIDRMKTGWLVWSKKDERYLAPPLKGSVYQWEQASEDAIDALRSVCSDADFWRSLSTHFAEENNQESLTMDHISATKSICKSVVPIVGCILFIIFSPNHRRCSVLKRYHSCRRTAG